MAKADQFPEAKNSWAKCKRCGRRFKVQYWKKGKERTYCFSCRIEEKAMEAIAKGLSTGNERFNDSIGYMQAKDIESHRRVIKDMLRRLTEYEQTKFGRDQSRFTAVTENDISEMLRSPNYALLASADSQFVGVITAIEAGPAELDLKDLYVSSYFHGKGVGSELVGRLLDWARQREMRRVHVVVDEQNDPAMSLFEAFQFTELARRRNLIKMELYLEGIT